MSADEIYADGEHVATRCDQGSVWDRVRNGDATHHTCPNGTEHTIGALERATEVCDQDGRHLSRRAIRDLISDLRDEQAAEAQTLSADHWMSDGDTVPASPTDERDDIYADDEHVATFVYAQPTAWYRQGRIGFSFPAGYEYARAAVRQAGHITSRLGYGDMSRGDLLRAMRRAATGR